MIEKKNVGDILTTQYDIVLNGWEIGGGSIRNHTVESLTSVLNIIGYDNPKENFGHMFEAFAYGTPPHGGCAQGFERLLMAVFGEEYLREVQAFPQTGSGRTSVMDAPSDVTDAQLRELGLCLVEKKLVSTYEEIIELLKKQKIAYKTYEHRAVHTSADAARVRGTDIHQGAKALIMYADSKPIMLVLPADLKVDARKFKELYKIRDLRMATAAEVTTLTGVAIGAVPPFGNLFDIPLYVDEKLRDNTEVVFNAGSHTKSIKLSEANFEKITKPTISQFSKTNG